MTTTYNGKQYTISLDPNDNPAPRPMTPGGRQRFREDLRPDRRAHQHLPRPPPRSYYGQALTVADVGYGANRIYSKYPKDSLRLTFTPRGPLIDGSTGQVVNRQIQVTDVEYLTRRS